MWARASKIVAIAAAAATSSWSLPSHADGALTIAPQLRPSTSAGSSARLGLSEAAPADLIGRYGLTAHEVLAELAPQLSPLVLVLKNTWTGAKGTVVHESYGLLFGSYEVADAHLTLHHQHNRLVMVDAQLPDYRLPAAPPAEGDFIPLDALGFSDVAEATRGKPAKIEKIIAESGGFAAAAWRINRFDPARGANLVRVIDAQTGAVLSEHGDGFALVSTQANVYEKNALDGFTIDASLPDLDGTGLLDGTYFSVFAPDANEPRATAAAGGFNFHPDDPAESLNFDQTEAYYTANKVLAFFTTRFGYSAGKDHLIVRINDIVSGQAGNAAYVPPPEGPEIDVGKGDEKIKNLARDTDVIAHEFTHHVLYPHLPNALGEAGILHEGTADFFAYAFNGDPNLGESVVTGSPYLRTAALAPGDLFDHSDPKRDTHWRGQYWSAVLWELRQKLGADAEQMVYESFGYLSATSGIREAFLALLNADRDLHPLPKSDPENAVFGANKCAILAAGVDRGFGFALGDYDGSTCGVDLTAAAAESRSALTLASDGPPVQGRRVSLSMFGRTCSTIGMPFSHEVDGPHRPLAPLWLLAFFLTPALIPLVLAAISRQKTVLGERSRRWI